MCERSGRCDSRLKTLSGAKPFVFSDKVAVRSRRWRVSVSAGARLDPGSGRQNVHDCSESSISHRNRKKTDSLGPLFEDEVDKKCAGDCSESSVSHENCTKLTGLLQLLQLRSTKFTNDCHS